MKKANRPNAGYVKMPMDKRLSERIDEHGNIAFSRFIPPLRRGYIGHKQRYEPIRICPKTKIFEVEKSFLKSLFCTNDQKAVFGFAGLIRGFTGFNPCKSNRN